MRKFLDITSVLCIIVALASLVMGVRVLTGHGMFVGLAIFSMARQGTFMGFIGNILGIAVTCGGFGAMAYYGFSGGLNAKKKAFGYGIAMTVICGISLLFAIFGHIFTIGDLLIVALPAVYTYAVLRTA